MLQQTQVSRVLPKYREFVTVFPTVMELAKATPADVLRVWRGMGYNRRALYLRKTAVSVIHDHKGRFPKIESELRKLPGLGMYTARALLVFAYKQDISMVDTNIRQIITHYFFGGKAQPTIVIAGVADQLVPKGKSWAWHQALMDFGSSELKKIHPPWADRNGKKKTSIPFKETNRYFRGKVIDRLRDGSYNEKLFTVELSGLFGKSPQFVAGIIDRLKNDGLVCISKSGIIRLPER